MTEEEFRSNVSYDVSVDDGKYRFVYFKDGTSPKAYRSGEEWPPFSEKMVGSRAILGLVAELAEYRDRDVHPYVIGPLTKAKVFAPNDLHNLADLQAILDAFERAFMDTDALMAVAEPAFKAGFQAGQERADDNEWGEPAKQKAWNAADISKITKH